MKGGGSGGENGWRERLERRGEGTTQTPGGMKTTERNATERIESKLTRRPGGGGKCGGLL